MDDFFKNVSWYIKWNLLQYIPGVQKICNEAVARKQSNLRSVPDHFKIQEMCIKAVGMNPWLLKFIPDHWKTYEMCDEAVAHNDAVLMDKGMIFINSNGVLLRLPSVLFSFIPDRLKTQEMCENAVEKIHGHWGLLLITLIPKRCAVRQRTWIHGRLDIFLTTLKHKKCVTRQWPATHTH